LLECGRAEERSKRPASARRDRVSMTVVDRDKAIDALWARCLIECEGLASACDASQHVTDFVRSLFLHELANDPLNVFEGVVLPAGRASEHAVGIRLLEAASCICRTRIRGSSDDSA
jgi:hypothetical protein